jgi:hypothetical protein
VTRAAVNTTRLRDDFATAKLSKCDVGPDTFLTIPIRN